MSSLRAVNAIKVDLQGREVQSKNQPSKDRDEYRPHLEVSEVKELHGQSQRTGPLEQNRWGGGGQVGVH